MRLTRPSVLDVLKGIRLVIHTIVPEKYRLLAKCPFFATSNVSMIVLELVHMRLTRSNYLFKMLLCNVSFANAYIKNTVAEVRQHYKIKETATINGPEGTVSSKTQESLVLLERGMDIVVEKDIVPKQRFFELLTIS